MKLTRRNVLKTIGLAGVASITPTVSASTISSLSTPPVASAITSKRMRAAIRWMMRSVAEVDAFDRRPSEVDPDYNPDEPHGATPMSERNDRECNELVSMADAAVGCVRSLVKKATGKKSGAVILDDGTIIVVNREIELTDSWDEIQIFTPNRIAKLGA